MSVGNQADRREEGEKQGILGGGGGGGGVFRGLISRQARGMTPPGTSLGLSHSYLYLQTSYTPAKDIHMLTYRCVCVCVCDCLCTLT